MDFSYSDDHQQVADLARRVFSDRVGDDYHRSHGPILDRELWQELAAAGLLAVSLDESHGGIGLGFLGACRVLQEQGRVLAPVPLLSATVAGLALAEVGNDALAAAFAAGEQLPLSTADAGLVLEGSRVRGTLGALAFAGDADYLVASAGDALVLVDLKQPGVELEAQQLTNELPAARLCLDAPCTVYEDAGATARLRQRTQAGTAMLQLGVLEEALRRTAEFTTERQQFGQPLARFQAVSQRAADAYIDIEALRATAESAAWRLDADKDARLEAQTALWWAAEAGHRVGHTAQHLHGGIGADLEYPIHRYFLWAKQLEFSQGGALASEETLSALLRADAALGGRK